MSDGNTLIGNALVGHGLDQGGEAPTQGDTYLAAEEVVMSQAEEHMMSQEDSIGDDEKMERQMLAVALVTSVVETSQQSPDPDTNSSSDPDAKQRYSLRKRRRASGEQALVGQPGANPSPVKVEPSSTTSSEPPPTSSALSQPPPSALPSVKQGVTAKAQQKTTRIQIKAPSPLPPPPSQPLITKVKTEAVPACTVAVAAAPLSIPLTASSLPKPSSLPPALQPPPRNSLPPMPPPKAASRAATKSKSAKDKSKRLVPAARVPATSQPLTPNPAAIGVPNPLSNPLPASSKSILVRKPKNPPPPPTTAAAAAAAPAASFKAGTKLTVPCPLPASTFQNGASQVATALPPAPDTEAVAPIPEKKKVTIDLPPQQRGRIFSIDLDPASLDFSVLDSGESGTPAPASADLPLVTGGARDRAFSFECFAFGINADEPLPPLAEQAAAEHDGSLAQQQDFVTLPRPRGDSIIFDPSSFQEGGIHEEHALTTRKTRGMSVDLEAAGLLPPSTESTAIPGTSDLQAPNYLSEHPSHHPGALPLTTPSASLPAAHPGSLPPLPPPPPGPPLLSHPDTAPSSLQTSVAPPSHAHMGHPHPPPPPPTHHHHHHGAHAATAPPPAAATAPTTTTHAYHHPGQAAVGVPHPVASAAPDSAQAGGAVSIISSCASSTTLQMELLNKDGRIGIYLPEARKERIARFHAKRKMRIWRKRIKYDCRKKLADSRPRIKGRFVKRSGTD